MKFHAIVWSLFVTAMLFSACDDHKKAADLAARGSRALEQGDYQSAAKDLEDAIRLDAKAPKLVYIWRARALAGTGDHHRAISEFELILADPTTPLQDRVGCMLELAASHQKLGQDAAAAADYEAALKLMPKSVSVLNNFAWFLATTPNDQIRNGDRSLDLSRSASQNVGTIAPEVLDTMAAAYAAKSDFASATKTQEQAIAGSQSESQKELLRQRLELYRNQKPYLESRP